MHQQGVPKLHDYCYICKSCVHSRALSDLQSNNRCKRELFMQSLRHAWKPASWPDKPIFSDVDVNDLAQRFEEFVALDMLVS